MKLLKIALLSLLFVQAEGQENIYDLKNSLKFGEYLLESGQPDFAIKEYERIIFLSPKDPLAQINLMKAYRLSGRNEDGLIRAQQLFQDVSVMPEKHALEYSKLLLNRRAWDKANSFWDVSQNLKSDDKILMKSTVSIFNSKFLEARQQLLTLQDSTNYLAEGYLSISNRALARKKKNPFAAGFMSMVIPGLGKAYTGDWKDGIVSLIFTSGLAFQAVRKFNQHGAGNYRPWVYTVIGSGFYLGNIFGSVKSAKSKNIKFINGLQHEASDLYNSYY
ncbi:MAG: tetratricopeptide (TPR) repeat protein [Arcticibacterium sp.]|jgi:tetratricopeptide (TPR) repeat protein